MNRIRDKCHQRPETTLEITPDGRIRGLWNDTLALPELGRCIVQRVSYIEFSMHRQCWCVREARPANWLRRLLQALFGRPLGRTLHAAPSREQALRWETRHFAPEGPGCKRTHSRKHRSRTPHAR
jgi:hypothetical protein